MTVSKMLDDAEERMKYGRSINDGMVMDYGTPYFRKAMEGIYRMKERAVKRKIYTLMKQDSKPDNDKLCRLNKEREFLAKGPKFVEVTDNEG